MMYGIEARGSDTDVGNNVPTDRRFRVNLTSVKGRVQPFQKNGFVSAVQRHLQGDVRGGLGKYEFSRPGGIEDFIEFKAEHPEYYDTEEEPALLRRHADVCASLVSRELAYNGKPLKVTLVSRGPGSEFLNKEGILIEAFQRAGIEIEGIVLIDLSAEALSKSTMQARNILPDVSIETVKANIFSADTKEKYTVIEGTTEVGTCFGLTPGNIDGVEPNGNTPSKVLEKQLKGIRGQQNVGAISFATFDHNPDKDSIERSYAGRKNMVCGFLKECFGVTNFEGVLYKPEHDIDTHLTSHVVDFTKRTKFFLQDKPKWFSEGLKLCFNLSFKPGKDTVIAANKNAGLNYPNASRHPEFSDLVLMGADNKRLGLHATIAA